MVISEIELGCTLRNLWEHTTAGESLLVSMKHVSEHGKILAELREAISQAESVQREARAVALQSALESAASVAAAVSRVVYWREAVIQAAEKFVGTGEGLDELRAAVEGMRRARS